MRFKRQLRSAWFTILKHSLNHLTRALARSSVGPFSIIRHVGRRSGKLYETPIIARRVKGGFMIELTYGHDVDWHKNVLAAGGCTLVWHGRYYVIDKIEAVDPETGRAAFSPFQRFILRLLKRKHFEKMSFQK
jgi:deazaflavin-dependent oxidoreductase (nitroreductase family)